MPRPKLEIENTPQALAPPEDGSRRRIKLRKQERQDLLRRRTIEAAAALFLDLENPHSWAEIAQELGLTVEKLKNLTRTKEFEEAYAAKFAELGHDPRYRVGQAAIMDLVPEAIKQLKALITGNTPPTVKMTAIRYVLDISGMKVERQDEDNERQELAEFLKARNITQVNIGTVNVAPEYAQEATKWGLIDTSSEDIPASVEAK